MYKKILVPVDGSPTSNAGLTEALRLAKESGAALRIFHLVDELVAISSMDGAGAYAGDLIEMLKQDGRRIVEKAAALARRKGVLAESVMQEGLGGSAADAIVKQAKKWRADLIVLGTHGRRGVKRLVMGSDAEQVIRMTPVPVLLVRSKEAGGGAARRSRRP